MAYLDLIPDIFPLTMPNLGTGQTYRTTKFNVSDKLAIGITVKASQVLSVSLAYGATSDTAAAAGVGGSASLPFMTSATSFASVTGAEGGTYHEISVPPSARQAQLVISNASGSTVSGATIDAALRVVAYPAASGSLSADEIVAKFTGTPDGAKYLRDDGTLATPSGGGTDASALTSGTLPAARLPGVLADVDTQAELLSAAAAAASHTHAASDIASGTVATARLGSGTANSSSYLRGDQTWATVSATDSTKLPLAGGTMTGPVAFSGAQTSAGASVANIFRDSSGNLTTNLATGAEFGINNNNILGMRLGPLGIAFYATNTSAGSSIPGIYRDSSSGLNINVPSGSQINFRRDGTLLGYFGGGTYAFDIGDYTGTGAGIVKYTSVTIYSATPAMIATASGNSTICAGAAGTTYPEVVVHGLSETAYAGAIEVKAGAVAYTNNGTWTNCFSLAKGMHVGDLRVFVNDGTNSSPLAWYLLFEQAGAQDITLYYAWGSNSHTLVGAGSAAAGNVAFRISGGYVQINVGTSMGSTLKFGFTFQGTVVS